MVPKSRNWAQALSTWRCPTPPGNSDGACDPCGRTTEGNWYHMHCELHHALGDTLYTARCYRVVM
jgi:hypothetical protein